MKELYFLFLRAFLLSRNYLLKKASAFLTIVFIVFPVYLAAQEKTITGTVTDNFGEPLSGVYVTVQGESLRGVITDISGNYNIKVSDSNSVLQFSFIGFKTVEENLDGRSIINVTMFDDILGLDEVVVVGYGVQKKSDVTGAMVRVGEDVLNVRPVSNVLEALQGQAAGVDISSNERPGEVGSIRIRGVRSLTASNDPLYVVDGIPLMSSSSIETLNPRDIESIDILKDASATAIYGSRGANGVVLISTKKGKEGQMSINYSGTYTFENIEDKAPMMNASDYITWRRWAHHNQNSNDYLPGDAPSLENDKKIFSADPIAWDNIQKGWASGSWDGSKVKSTDWTDYVSQTAHIKEHTLSVSGGTDKIQSYASFGYLSQDGTQIGQEYDRYTAKVSLDIKPKDWFNMGATMNVSWSEQDYGMSTLGASSSTWPNSIYDAAKRIYSHALPYDNNGDIILNPGGDVNIYTIINEWNQSTQQRQVFRGFGSFYSQINFEEIFSTLKGLKYRVNFGPDYRNWREGVYIDANSVNRLGGTSFARLNNQRDFSWTLDNMITYDRNIDRHNIGVTLLQTASSWNIENSSLSGQNIPKASYLWNSFGSLDVTSPDAKVGIGSGLSERKLASYMGRVNYSFADKYLLTVSGRWDGASQLSEGHKWAFFPSAALGWRIEQEEFAKDFGWLDQLKLRFGIGSTGNSAVGPYQTLGAIQGFFVPFGGSSNTQAYSINEPNYTATLIPMANKELTWETTTQYNLGIDFSILRNRIGGTIDIYKSYTEDLLMDMRVLTLSGSRSTYANVGETKNKGVDVSLNTLNINTKDFKWKSSINAAWQKDEIVTLAYGKNDMVDNTWFIGESISVIYGIENDGLWKDEDATEMQKFNDNGHNFEVGMVKPIDQDENYIIDADDRVIIGNRNPNWTLGFNNTFSYKGFDLDIITFGRFGYMLSTGGESQLGRYNQREIDYWTPSNKNAEFQKPIYNEAGGDQYSSSLGYRAGAFFKIRTISLGYNISPSKLNNLGIENLRFYVQAKNPGSIYNSISWMDMDLGSSLYNRGYVFGVNVSF